MTELDSKSGWSELPEELMVKTSMQVFFKLSLAKDSPRLLVLIAHGFIELMVNVIVDARCKNSKRIANDSRGYPHSVRLVLLHELDLLSDYQFRILDQFRKLRNKAAHDPLFEFDLKDFAHTFNELASSHGEDSNHQVKDLHSFCILLIAIIWTSHRDLLSDVFL